MPPPSASAEGSQGQEPKKMGVVKELWETKLWRLVPMFVVYITCITTLLPVKPNLMTDFFASRGQHHYIQCERYSVGHAPKACADAHAAVVIWQSWSDFFANTILLSILAPIVGRWSDAYGRRPFLVLCFVFAGLPVIVLTLHIQYNLSLYYYFPVMILNTAFSSVSIAMSSIADVIQSHNRAPAFGVTMSSFSVGILIGPTLGGHLTPLQCGWFAAIGVGCCILYVIFFLPETVSADSKKQARLRQVSKRREQSLLRPWQGFNGLDILLRNPLFMKLTLVLMLNGIVSEGLWEIMTQYLQLQLGFTTLDNSHLFSLAGIVGLVNNTIGMRVLVGLMGETNMMRFGIGIYAIEMALLAFAPSKNLAMAAICFGCLGSCVFPAIATIKSNNVAASEQGSMQGALYGARALAQGVGPLGFSYLFSYFSHPHSTHPYLPGAPFAVGALLMLVTFGVTLTIDRRAADSGLLKTVAEAKADSITEPLLAADEEAAAAKAEDIIPPPTGTILGIVPPVEVPVSLHHVDDPEAEAAARGLVVDYAEDGSGRHAGYHEAAQDTGVASSSRRNSLEAGRQV